MELVFRIIGIITPVLGISVMGYFYARIRRPDMTVVNRMSTEVFFPLLIFAGMVAKDFHLLDYMPLMIGGAVLALGSGLLSWGVARLLHYNPRTFVPSMMFSNVGNMGIPLTVVAFGQEMLSSAVALFTIFSLLHVTLGIRIVAPHATVKGILRGPMFWSMILGVIASLLKIPIPDWVMMMIRMLGEIAIPLGLFSLGVSFASFKIERWSMGIVGAVVCPLSGLLIVWPLLMWLPLTPQMQGVLVLYAALPPAVMNYIFAEQYRQEPAQVSAIVVIGSIASIFFIPLALSFVL